jgi:hypothetical protein
MVAEAKPNTTTRESRVLKVRCAVQKAISASSVNKRVVAKLNELFTTSNDLFIELDRHRADGCWEGIQAAETGLHCSIIEINHSAVMTAVRPSCVSMASDVQNQAH